jgi:ABC-type dipeptide/oligopeptide/nickel transport system ATPase component
MIRGGDIGLIVQDPRSALNPLMTIGSQVANVCIDHGLASKAEADARAIAALEAVGIDDVRRRANSYPRQISGGMAQRVLIAMATINRPKLLIADEPTTGLDVTVQAQILDLLRERVRSSGAAILLVTHDLGVVAHYCDRVVVMLNGRLVEEAPVVELFASPRHPYTKRLLESTADQSVASAHGDDS